MKKIFLIIYAIILLLITITSCTTNDVKEISGTLVFRDIGSHNFNINADNIEATITIAGPNNGEVIVYKKVSLFRTTDYTAKLGVSSSNNTKTELLNNLVVMYEAKSGGKISKNSFVITNPGFVKIEWIGIN